MEALGTPVKLLTQCCRLLKDGRNAIYDLFNLLIVEWFLGLKRLAQGTHILGGRADIQLPLLLD